MSTTPNPTMMARLKKPPVATAVIADIRPDQDAKVIVRPGLRRVVDYDIHDGVVKAKHLKEGQTVRAFLHGKARGGERVVKSVERIEDGAKVRVEFSSPHPPTEYKAAYRFFDKELEGTPVERSKMVPALVPYEEV